MSVVIAMVRWSACHSDSRGECPWGSLWYTSQCHFASKLCQWSDTVRVLQVFASFTVEDFSLDDGNGDQILQACFSRIIFTTEKSFLTRSWNYLTTWSASEYSKTAWNHQARQWNFSLEDLGWSLCLMHLQWIDLPFCFRFGFVCHLLALSTYFVIVCASTVTLADVHSRLQIWELYFNIDYIHLKAQGIKCHKAFRIFGLFWRPKFLELLASWLQRFQKQT